MPKNNKKTIDMLSLDELGFDIKTARKERGISQEQLCIMCGVSMPTLRRWEIGLTRQIKKENFDKIREILG